MEHNFIKKPIIEKFGEQNSAIVTYLFEKATELADNNQLKETTEIFNIGIELIREGKGVGADDGSYSEDIDRFLDLKIKIDEALN